MREMRCPSPAAAGEGGRRPGEGCPACYTSRRFGSFMRRSFILAFIVFAAFGCHRKPSTPPDVVARVGDRMITLSDFKRYVDRNGGTDLAQITAEHSLAPNAKKGGDIGYVSRGELPKRFEDEIFGLQPGHVSGVIQTDNSFHIFKVDDRRPPGTIDLQTAAPVIREKLREEAIRTRMAQLVAKSKADLQITVLTKRLPFPYSGTLPKSANE